jgi:hypothetical protein
VEALAEAVSDSVRADWLIAPVAGLAAGNTLLLDVGDLAVGAHLAIPAGNTPARKCREAEKSDETHSRKRPLQSACLTSGSSPISDRDSERPGITDPSRERRLEPAQAGAHLDGPTKRLDRGVLQLRGRNADWIPGRSWSEKRNRKGLNEPFRPMSRL